MAKATRRRRRAAATTSRVSRIWCGRRSVRLFVRSPPLLCKGTPSDGSPALERPFRVVGVGSWGRFVHSADYCQTPILSILPFTTRFGGRHIDRRSYRESRPWPLCSVLDRPACTKGECENREGASRHVLRKVLQVFIIVSHNRNHPLAEARLGALACRQFLAHQFRHRLIVLGNYHLVARRQPMDDLRQLGLRLLNRQGCYDCFSL